MDPVPGADDVPAGDVGDDVGGDGAPGSASAPIEPGTLGPHPERHPDDLPPPERSRRGIPSGVLWALALAVLVLTIASWVAFSTQSTNDAAGDVERLNDPSFLESPGLGDAPDKTGQPASSIPYVTFDGQTTSLAERTGRPVVVNFWASGCVPCITEMPAFEAVHQRVGDQVDFVGLAVNDGETKARELARSTGVTYDLGFDGRGQIVIDSGGVRLPTTVFIGADGRILEVHHQELDEAGLQDLIEQHFGVAASGS